jgi:hypothetical protein
MRGEIGVLKDVRCHPDRPGRIYLTVEHGGADYVGCLSFKNAAFCEVASAHLRRCYGMFISDIGSSDLAWLRAAFGGTNLERRF